MKIVLKRIDNEPWMGEAANATYGHYLDEALSAPWKGRVVAAHVCALLARSGTDSLLEGGSGGKPISLILTRVSICCIDFTSFIFIGCVASPSLLSYSHIVNKDICSKKGEHHASHYPHRRPVFQNRRKHRSSHFQH